MNAAEHRRGHGNTAAARLNSWLPGIGEEARSCRQVALLIFRVRCRGALPNLICGLVRNPSVHRGLQSVGFRRHQAGGPKKRLRTRFSEKVFEKGLTRTSQDDGGAIT